MLRAQSTCTDKKSATCKWDGPDKISLIPNLLSQEKENYSQENKARLCKTVETVS